MYRYLFTYTARQEGYDDVIDGHCVIDLPQPFQEETDLPAICEVIRDQYPELQDVTIETYQPIEA